MWRCKAPSTDGRMGKREHNGGDLYCHLETNEMTICTLTPEQLREEGYDMVFTLPNGDLYALYPFLFTVAIIGPLDNYGYDNRWCYHDLNHAQGAFMDWMAAGYAGEPQGWHRHIPSGRRRLPDGTEVIAH